MPTKTEADKSVGRGEHFDVQCHCAAEGQQRGAVGFGDDSHGDGGGGAG